MDQAAFNRAVATVSRLKAELPAADKLGFYGLFKQVASKGQGLGVGCIGSYKQNDKQQTTKTNKPLQAWRTRPRGGRYLW